MRAAIKSSLLLILTAWLSAACNENTVYYSYQSTPSKGWTKGDTLLFNVPLTDSLTRLKLFVEVRNESEYLYQDLYMVISHNLKDSTQWRTDTLKFIVADKEGKWRGTGWGSLFLSTLPLGECINRHPGDYTIKVAHGMKDEQLIGISDVGIRIEK